MGGVSCVAHAAAIRLSGYPANRPDRRPARAPLHVLDRRHRLRARRDRFARRAPARRHARSLRQRDRHAGSGKPEAPRQLRHRRAGVRRRQHHGRRLPPVATRARRPARPAAGPDARRASRHPVRRGRARARCGGSPVHPSRALPRRRGGGAVHGGRRVRGRRRRVARRGGAARVARPHARRTHETAPALRRPAARRSPRGRAGRVRRARCGGARAIQGPGHRRRRVRGAEPVREQRGARRRRAPRPLRRDRCRAARRALPPHPGRDRLARRGGLVETGAHDVDGGEMRRAALLLSVLPTFQLSAQDDPRISEAQAVLAPLVESYGASGAEGPVRETVKRLLPAWANAETDTAGNLWLRVGQGDPVVVFVAHLDEIGFTVDSILDDGSLHLRTRGGFYSSLFEAQPALVHGSSGDVPGIFLPRDTGFVRHAPPPLRASIGSTSRAATLARGVRPGATGPMPKPYVRLAGTRATGRSFDDRVGSAAQLLALRRLDRAKLKHQVIFVWSVREEIGLEGAAVAAAALGPTVKRVHAIDTFVSADSPLELQSFAVAPLGQGAVARALDNSSVTPPAYVDSLVALARARGVKLQVGTTNGGNDGSVFTDYGAVDVALGWPLRYSHSPAELVDLKDVASLADLIQAAAEAW